MTDAMTRPHRLHDHGAEREKALADGIMEVACELRLVDVIDFLTYVRTENHPNLGDLVNSSAELHFREGTLCYGWSAQADMKWSGSPAITLDMEFRNLSVTAFFKLVLETQHAGVDLHYIAFDAPSVDPKRNTHRLVDAIRDARLTGGGERHAG